MHDPFLLTDPAQALAALGKATAAFANTEADSEQTLRLALDHLMEVTGSDAGAIAVPSERGDGQPVLIAERFLDEGGPVSRTVLQQTLADAEPDLLVAEPPESASVYAAGITSLLCTPVVHQGRTLAAVYLDRRGKPPYDETARNLAACFASILALRVDLTRRVERTEKRAEEARAIAAHVHDYWSFGNIATNNRSFAECLQLAERVARSDTTLLILGETGSGKEHLARCVHAESERRAGPFQALNCAAIPETLLESELFGHERGAFTGAVGTRRGKFELADGGTLFLDEIGDLPLAMQPKLLRVLEDRRITRVGGNEERRLDVRILAATHHSLAEAVKAGRFREDLYYRLSVVELRLPPLRERIEDLPQLAEAFLAQERERTGRSLRWSAAALRRLSRHPWPGNVRELRNAVEKLCLLVDGPTVTADEVDTYALADRRTEPGSAASRFAAAGGEPLQRRVEDAEHEIRELRRGLEELRATLRSLAGGALPSGAPREALVPAPAEPAEAAAASEDGAAPAGESYHEQMEDASRQIVARALKQTGSITAAARLLGLSRQSLSVKCKQLGLEKG